MVRPGWRGRGSSQGNNTPPFFSNTISRPGQLRDIHNHPTLPYLTPYLTHGSTVAVVIRHGEGTVRAGAGVSLLSTSFKEPITWTCLQMLAELKDLGEKGLFSPVEIKQIIKKRTAFETALVRRIPNKNDYLRYAAYEMGLEALRRKRATRMSMSPYLSPPPLIFQLVFFLLHIMIIKNYQSLRHRYRTMH